MFVLHCIVIDVCIVIHTSTSVENVPAFVAVTGFSSRAERRFIVCFHLFFLSELSLGETGLLKTAVNSIARVNCAAFLTETE